MRRVGAEIVYRFEQRLLVAKMEKLGIEEKVLEQKISKTSKEKEPAALSVNKK